MRTLLVLRGIPGCGKSTWVKDNRLEPYTLSSDSIRLMYQAPALGVNGEETIASWEDKAVWKTLFEMLEARMRHGEFVVIDATHTSINDLSRYKTLIQKYRYRLFVVDFSDISLETAKERNNNREPMKRVPEYVIDKMYDRLLDNLKVPSGMTLIKPSEFDSALMKPIDLTAYKKIHHIGDIHGCHTALMSYLKDGLSEEEFYIFTGDYIDRGIENAKVISFLLSIADMPNVMLLEGNHEKWLTMWSNNEKTYSKEFESQTRSELDVNGISKKDVRIFCKKLAQCAYYKYNNNIYLVSHGGISNYPNNPIFIATKQLIEGVGSYGDVIAVEESFARNFPDNYYQIHGHRNPANNPIDFIKRNYNLEGGVEFGQYLRCLQITKEGVYPIYTKNEITKDRRSFESVSELVECLQKDENIKEKKYGNISSFNFTRKAFENKDWNARTVRARGLFIDTEENKICARAYEKFFNREEVFETTDEELKKNLKFPVKSYVKENGFLGIVGYDKKKDELFITSKSNPTSIFAFWFKQLLEKNTTIEQRHKMLNYIKENDVSFVFEVVDQENDAHIIDYDKSDVYLLDIIHNNIEFSKIDYDEMVEIAKSLDLKHKELAITINNFNDLLNWFEEVEAPEYKYKGNYIEGFVLEDANGFMFKEKLYYYRQWKRLRGLKDRILNGKSIRVHVHDLNELELEFYGFLTELKKENTDIPENICVLRRMFFQERIYNDRK
jgi:predicted kinase